VGRFLVPEEIESLLIIQPAASGDVALTTTLIARVKALNPQCHITLMTRAATASVAALCLDVDAKEVLPVELESAGRRQILQHFADRANQVVYCWYLREESDLGTRYNLRETIYLLAGWPTPPDRPAPIRLKAPAVGRSGEEILRSLLSRPGRWLTCRRWMVRAGREFCFSVVRLAKKRQVKDSGLRSSLQKFFRVAKHSCRVLARKSPPKNSRNVVLALTALSLAPPPSDLAVDLVQRLKKAGWTVLQNLGLPSEALIPGTVPFCCPYDDFLRIRESGVPLVGWRSGLCDLAAAVDFVPMVILYPAPSDSCFFPHSTSLEALGVRGDFLEMVCPSAESLDWPRLIDYLNRRSA
jgi:hypothetical protein